MGIMPVGVLLFVLLPLIVYKIYPPELKSSPDVPIWAAEELKKMGRLSVREISMALLALLALGLWIFGGDLINATTVALLVLSLMVMTRIVEWDDVLAHKQAWNVLVWFATLVTMADGLNKVGFLKWFAGGAASALSGYSVMTIVVALTVVYFVVHYMFASLTAHTTVLLPVLLTAAIAVPEMSVKLIALLFCYTLGLMGIISPYATGPGPIYYGSGYVSRKEFWMLGLIFGAIYLAVIASCTLLKMRSCRFCSRRHRTLVARSGRRAARAGSHDAVYSARRRGFVSLAEGAVALKKIFIPVDHDPIRKRRSASPHFWREDLIVPRVNFDWFTWAPGEQHPWLICLSTRMVL
jgi:di/tricarboxylate transporter